MTIAAMAKIGACLAIAALAACGSPDRDGAGGLTASQADALNQAAARVDAQGGVAGGAPPGLNPAATAAARADRERAASPR